MCFFVLRFFWLQLAASLAYLGPRPQSVFLGEPLFNCFRKGLALKKGGSLFGFVASCWLEDRGK